MSFSLRRRSAIVTGAASGIGLAVSEQLAKEGAHVLMVDRSSAVATYACELNQACPATVHSKVGSVTVRGFADECFDYWQEVTGVPVSVLVPAAGIARNGRFVSKGAIFSSEVWDTVIAVNLTAPMFWAGRLIAGIEEARREAGKRKWHPDEGTQASILMVSSIIYKGNDGQAAYAAAKGGLISGMRSLAIENRFHGISVAAICPTYVNTPMLADVPEEALEKIRAKSLIGRLLEPQEVAATIVHMIRNPAYTGTAVEFTGGAEPPF